jgi:MYXO-CTERM domain-containing protein
VFNSSFSGQKPETTHKKTLLNDGSLKPKTRRKETMLTGMIAALIVSVNGVSPCEITNHETYFEIASSADRCNMSCPNGSMITLNRSSVINLDSAQPNQNECQARLVNGSVQVNSQGLRTVVTGMGHQVASHGICDVGLQEDLLVVRSRESDCEIQTCVEPDETTSCESRIYTIIPEEIVAVEKNGDWYYRQDQWGNKIYSDEEGGCSTTSSSSGLGLLMGIVLFALLRRRRR